MSEWMERGEGRGKSIKHVKGGGKGQGKGMRKLASCLLELVSRGFFVI